jgi:hypothetical protein
MITQVYFRPKFYSAGYNPVIWSVESDKVEEVDFKFVFDIYVDGVYVNRIKQRPNPQGAGLIDLSVLLNAYLDPTRFANETGTPTSTPLKIGEFASCSVFMYVGEEYRTGAYPAPLRIYTGTANTVGTPSYYLGAQGYSNRPVIALPISLDWKDQQQTLAVQQTNDNDYYGLFGALAPYVLKSNAIYSASTCGGVGKFLSYMPRTVAGGAWQTTPASPSKNFTAKDLIYDRHTLTFLNRNPVYQYKQVSSTFPYLQASSPKVVWYEFYNADNESIGHYAISNSENFGGGPRPDCGDPIVDFDQETNQELVSVRVGPKDLEEMGVLDALPELPAYYTVQLFANLTIAGNCTYTGEPTNPLSEIVTIQLTEDCYSYLYPRARLVWLNPLGGREYWNFDMKVEETVEAENAEFYQTEVDWSGTTPVELTGDTTLNWLRGGMQQYNKTTHTKYTITSNFLTQEEVELLKTAVMSPQQWVYIGQEDWPYTCTIAQKEFTVKSIKQVKLFTATFEIELAVDRTM